MADKPYQRPRKPVVRHFGAATASPAGQRRVDRATRDEMDHIHSLIDNGQREESLDFVDRLVEKYPTDVALYNNAATTCFHIARDAKDAGDSDRAYEYFVESLRYALDGLQNRKADVKLLCACGIAYREIGTLTNDHDNFDKAEKFYERALLIRPDDKFTYTGIAFLYLDWADQLDDTESDLKTDVLRTAANALESARRISPEDNVVLDKIDFLRSIGFKADEEAYTLDDIALDIIENGDQTLFPDQDEENPEDRPRPRGTGEGGPNI